MSNKQYRFYLLVRNLLIAVTALTTCFPGAGIAAPEQFGVSTSIGRFIIVTVPYWKWDLAEEGIERSPNLERLQQEARFALMNTATAGDDRLADAYVTLGGGTRLRAGNYGGRGGSTQQTTSGHSITDAYTVRTGHVPAQGELIEPDIEAVKKYNSTLNYPARPGLLGDTLRRNGWRVELFSPPWNAFEADMNGTEENFALLAVIDENGRVAGGDLSATAVETFIERLHGAPGNTILWFDFKALVALQRHAPYMSTDREHYWRARAQSEFDQLLGSVFEYFDRGNTGQLWVLSPTNSPEDRRAGDRLAPLYVWRTFDTWDDTNRSNLLTSGTTRRPGLVANIDFAPSLLSALDVDIPHEMLGRSWRPSTPTGTAEWGDLRHFYKAAVANQQHRPLFVKTFVSTTIVLLLLTGVTIVARRPKRWGSIRYIWLGITSIPLAYLIAPWFGVPASPLLLVLCTVSVVIVTGLAIVLSPNSTVAFGFVALITSAIILWDVISGAHLMILSPLGYSPIAGARYYGIGNEFMGVLIGSVLVGGGILFEWSKRVAVRPVRVAVISLYFMLTFLLLASPSYGANFGGSLAAIIGFTYTVSRLLWPRRYRQLLIGMLITGFLVLSIFISGDMADGVSHSHVGRAAVDVRQGGVVTALQIITRKWAMNVKIIRYTNWSHVLISTLAVYIMLLFWPPGRLKQLLERRADLSAALSGCAIASITAFFVNDSGVVAAATMIVYAIAVLLDLVIVEIAGSTAI